MLNPTFFQILMVLIAFYNSICRWWNSSERRKCVKTNRKVRIRIFQKVQQMRVKKFSIFVQSWVLNSHWFLHFWYPANWKGVSNPIYAAITINLCRDTIEIITWNASWWLTWSIAGIRNRCIDYGNDTPQLCASWHLWLFIMAEIIQ